MNLTKLRARCLVPASEASNPASINPLSINIANGVITSLEELAPDANCDVPHLVVPGFIDLQINGIDADDLWDIARQQDLSAWHRLEDKLLDQGVTAWCPTFISAPQSDYRVLNSFLKTLNHSDSLQSRMVQLQPTMLGIHLEGPFLGSALGAHSPSSISEPEWSWLTDIISEVALMTIGAESDLAVELCRSLIHEGVVVSLGHTAPSHLQYTSLRRAGATMVTHLYNAMSGLHHRQPGLAAWALTDDQVFCSLIADGVHVEPTMIRLAFRSQPNHMVLVTDRVAHLNRHLYGDDGAVRLKDKTLAGSLLTMSEALRICVEVANIPRAQALSAATKHPAQVLGLSNHGQIKVGARADLVALDDQFTIQSVWLGGERVR